MRRTLALIGCGLAVAGLAACGGEDAPDTRLTEALGAVSAGETSEGRFAWTDMAALRELAGGELDLGGEAFRRWSIPIGVGAPELVGVAGPLREDLALDLLAADRTMTIGSSFQGATRVDGADASAVAEAVEADGATAQPLGDREVLRVEEGLPLPGDPLARIFVTGGGAVLAEGDTVAFAREDAGLLEVLGDGDEPLGDRPDQAAAAACLGDVVAAEIMKGVEAGATQTPYVAIGVRDGDEPVEVLCAIGDREQADDAVRELTENLRPEATSIVTNQPLSELLQAVEVDDGESGDRFYAQAVVTPLPERPLGLLWQALATRELAAWLGAAGPS